MERILRWIYIQLYEKISRERLIIELNKVDPNKKTLPEIIGIDIATLNRCEEYLFIKYTPEGLLDMLGLKTKEIIEALAQSWKPGKKATEVIIDWWQKRGRKAVTLEEFVGSLRLMEEFENLKLPYIQLTPDIEIKFKKKMPAEEDRSLYIV